MYNVSIKKGELQGYSLSLPKINRRDILIKVVKKDSLAKVVKRLNLLAIFNKNKYPEKTLKVRRDIKFLDKHFKQSGEKLAKSHNKKNSKKRSCKSKKIEKVMREFKNKNLYTSYHKKVSNPKQAIAIALSMATKLCKN
jgi:hypothetical protein